MAASDSTNVFTRLDNYNFLEDKKFLAGWTSVRNSASELDRETLARKFLEAKVFYFSRFIEPVSLNDYVVWRQKNDDAKNEDGHLKSPESGDTVLKEKLSNMTIDCTENEDKSETSGCEGLSNIGHKQDSVASEETDEPKEDSVETAHPSDALPKYPPSFYEIMQKIENGEPIPGVEDLNIEPTNSEPTMSNLQRVSKPWEQSS